MEQIWDKCPICGTMDLNLIRSFVTVCEQGSVTEAAKLLKQPKSTISRHLGRLEQELDCALLDRSHTGVSLTPEGKRLLEQTRESIHLLEPIGYRSLSAQTKGHVRIAAPRYYARGPIKDVVRSFLAEAPQVTIDCLSENRLSSDPRENVDIEVSIGDPRDGLPDTWQIGTVAAKLYAAPGFFEPDAAPKSATQLSGASLLSSCGVSGVPQRIALSNGKSKSVTATTQVRLVSNELDLLLGAAHDGVGLVVLPEFIGSKEVAEERLSPILPDHWVDRFSVSISLLRKTRESAARSFMDFAVPRLRAVHESTGLNA